MTGGCTATRGYCRPTQRRSTGSNVSSAAGPATRRFSLRHWKCWTRSVRAGEDQRRVIRLGKRAFASTASEVHVSCTRMERMGTLLIAALSGRFRVRARRLFHVTGAMFGPAGRSFSCASALLLARHGSDAAYASQSCYIHAVQWLTLCAPSMAQTRGDRFCRKSGKCGRADLWRFEPGPSRLPLVVVARCGGYVRVGR